MSNSRDVVITGIGVELPGVDAAAIAAIAGMQETQLRPEAFDPKAKVARKGIRYKDTATLLAMSAGLIALRDAGLPVEPEEQTSAPDTGVVVSCNLGNLDTVARVVQLIRAEHVNALSAMDLPNASSNVVASSLAIRHGLQGPNLMLCNGATSSLDALHLAANCIRASRAQRMLVVGVEVDNPTTRAMPLAPERWFHGAVAVVLEAADAAQARGAEVKGRLGDYRFDAAGRLESGTDAAMADAADRIDVTSNVGESYGAEGLVQLISVLQRPAAGPRRALLACGEKFGDQALATLTVELPG